jgi:hypothetical protein
MGDVVGAIVVVVGEGANGLIVDKDVSISEADDNGLVTEFSETH